MNIRADSANPLHKGNSLLIVSPFRQPFHPPEIVLNRQGDVLYDLSFTDDLDLAGFFQGRMIRTNGNSETHACPPSLPFHRKFQEKIPGGSFSLSTSVGSLRPVKSTAK